MRGQRFPNLALLPARILVKRSGEHTVALSRSSLIRAKITARKIPGNRDGSQLGNNDLGEHESRRAAQGQVTPKKRKTSGCFAERKNASPFAVAANGASD